MVAAWDTGGECWWSEGGAEAKDTLPWAWGLALLGQHPASGLLAVLCFVFAKLFHRIACILYALFISLGQTYFNTWISSKDYFLGK